MDPDLSLPFRPRCSPSITPNQSSALLDVPEEPLTRVGRNGEVEYHYDERTGELEIAPDYPIMQPISTNVDSLEFLQDSTPGNATLQIINPDGEVLTLDELNLEIIEKAARRLAHSFQPVASQRIFAIRYPQTPVIALLRGVYLGDYLLCEAMMDRPVPLLLHLQVLKLAIDYRVNAVVEQAQANALKVIQDTEDSPENPLLDICDIIRLLYTELRPCNDLKAALAMYCLKFYPHHKGELFRQTAFESPAFHRDLQHANCLDSFRQDWAGDITRLPVCDHWSHQDDLPAWKGANDFTCQFHTESIHEAYGIASSSRSRYSPLFDPAPERGSKEFPIRALPSMSSMQETKPAARSLAVKSGIRNELRRADLEAFPAEFRWFATDESTQDTKFGIVELKGSKRPAQTTENKRSTRLWERVESTPTEESKIWQNLGHAREPFSFLNNPAQSNNAGPSTAAADNGVNLHDWDVSSPTADSSDSEWAMIDARDTHSQHSDNPLLEEHTSSDYEWIDVDLDELNHT